MQYKNKRTVLIYMLIFLLVSLGGMLLSNVPFFNNFSRIFYGGIIVVWTMTVLRRITDNTLKRLLLMSAVLLLLIILFQALRYQFEPGGVTVHRIMMYCYYLPFLIIPVITLKISFRCGCSENVKINHLWDILYFPAVVLCVLFLTNDRHHQVFVFERKSLFEDGLTVYSHGPVYYVGIAWISVLIFASVAIILVRFASKPVRKDSWAYYVVLGCSIYFLLTDYFDVSPVFNGIRYLNPADTFTIFIVCGWEACIQTCLLPSNSGYSYFFENSGMIAEITDKNGIIKIASKGSESDWDNLAEDYHILEKPVWGGTLKFAEDISSINSFNRELKEISERLSEENSIQEAENALQQEKVQVSVMNRLYDDITDFSSEKTKEIESLLNEAVTDEEFKGNLCRACVLASYIKRRGNLYLLGEETSEYDFNDLYLSFKESLDYFALGGVKVMLSKEGSTNLERKTALSAYDWLQSILEQLLGKTKCFLVHMIFEKTLTVRLMFDSDPRIKEIMDAIEMSGKQHGVRNESVKEENGCFYMICRI